MRIHKQYTNTCPGFSPPLHVFWAKFLMEQGLLQQKLPKIIWCGFCVLFQLGKCFTRIGREKPKDVYKLTCIFRQLSSSSCPCTGIDFILHCCPKCILSCLFPKS